MRSKVIIGSRKSKLAMAQTKLVIAALEKFFPTTIFEIRNVVTEGTETVRLALPKLVGRVSS